MRLKANAAYVTDVGRVRSENQDAAAIAQNPATEWPIFVVADGMGGHAAGEVAARLAVEALVEVAGDPEATPDPDERLREAVAEAQRRIQIAAAEDPNRAQMGTTCLIALFNGHHLHLAHVGDSRVYLYRGDTLEQLTDDHSWVHEQVRRGLIDSAEAARHPMRHVITRALSVHPVEADLIHRELAPGDWLLLCSDGLTGPVDDATIAATLATADHPEHAARRLVELANEAGGPDNVTVLLVRLETIEPLPAPPPEPERRRSRPGTKWLAVIGIVVVALIVAIVLFILSPANQETPLAPNGIPTPTFPAAPGLPGPPRPRAGRGSRQYTRRDQPVKRRLGRTLRPRRRLYRDQAKAGRRSVSGR